MSTTALPDQMWPRESGARGDGEMLPVEQVGGDGVAPVHADGEADDVVLIEEVPLAGEIDEAVGIVDPAGGRGEVVGGTVGGRGGHGLESR